MARQLCDDVTSDDDPEDYGRWIAQAIEDVASGRIAKWEANGVWTVTIQADGVVFALAIMDGEPGGKVSLETYRMALEAWRKFLADEDCYERIVELPDA